MLVVESVIMATDAKMSFNPYQNGKFNAMPQGSQGIEVSQDMHLKMSKKIAQLTKVIYALNTKNDEHESVLQAVREQHEEAIQQLLAETRQKISEYQQKVSAEADHSKRIQELESQLLENERYKKDALANFEKYKTEAEEREVHFRSEHSQRMISLSQEVLHTKREFDNRLREIDQLKESMKTEKETALEELRVKHEQELAKVLLSQKSQNSELTVAQKELQDRHELELAKLREQYVKLESSKKELAEDYELKLNKAQAFYDKELEALKSSQITAQNQSLMAAQEQNDQLRRDLAFQETQFKQRINELINQLSISEEDVAKYKGELTQLQHKLNSQNSDADFADKQLQKAKQQVAETLTRLKELEADLTASRERCDQQAQQLLKKSTELGALEATKLQHESTICDLQAQLEKLKDRVGWLEGAKRALESESQSQAQQQTGQLRSLEKALEDLSKEKQKQKEHYEQELREQEMSWQKRQHEQEDSHTRQLTSTEKRYQDQGEAERKSAQAKLDTLRQDLNAQMDAERTKLSQEQRVLKAQYDEMQEQLSGKLAEAKREIQRLEKIVAESEQGLGSATSNISSLKDQNDRLRAELDQARVQLRALQAQSSALENLFWMQSDYGKLKTVHETKVKEAEVELKTKLDQLAKDLDNKWTDTLRAQCEKLRRDLTDQKDADKKAALAQLMKMQEEEMSAAKQGWERKVSELLSEISQLKKQLDAQQEVTSGELDRLRLEASAENQQLRQELLDSAQEYSRKVAAMEESFQAQMDHLQHKKDRDAKEREEELRGQHQQAFQAELAAHSVAVQALKDKAEKDSREQLLQQATQHAEKMDSMKMELDHKLAHDLEQMERAHHMQMQAARMELERAIELTKQKEVDYAMQVSELEEDIRHRRISMETLEAEISKLQCGMADMSHELEAKGKELLKIRSEANHAARVREEQLEAAHQEELSAVRAEHDNEVQAMLGEFTQAQEILKNKIAELKTMLEEAEDRYNERESRPEDVEKIESLQRAVKEREQVLKKMEDEKRYFQMELVNRETNFNKVFNSTPNVGVLNPFQGGKKGKERGNFKVSSSPALVGRLQPLPGSPIHDEKFNPAKPLPPPVKKFVH